MGFDSIRKKLEFVEIISSIKCTFLIIIDWRSYHKYNLLHSPGLGVQDPEGLVLRDGQQGASTFIKLNPAQIFLGNFQLFLEHIFVIVVAGENLTSAS